MPHLICGGMRLALGERIGRGGEGEVYRAADGSDRAVKIYLQPDVDREAKVSAFVAGRLGQSCSNVAFPLDIVHTVENRFAGFTMREVAGHEPIHELISTGSRRERFPDANWRFLVRAALNVARIVASVHAAGVVIGDINSAGFLVSRQATVVLIDADSFQIGAHRCRVGMPEYTPPELQAIRFDKIDRTQDHDAFGLAVMLFQILALGRHPFAGVPSGRPMPIDTAIMQARFAFSQLRTVGVDPPPGALLLSDLPRAIQLLFERAFKGRGGARPVASDWARELETLQAVLVRCPDNPDHHVANLATHCPWCRIERQTGRALFGNVITPRPPPAGPPDTQLHQEVNRAVRRAKKHAGEAIVPTWPRAVSTPSKAARKVLAPNGIGAGQAATFVEQHSAARIVATHALDAWRTSLGIWDNYKLIAAIQRSLEELDQIRRQQPRLLARAAERRVSERMMDLMRTIAIGSVPIAGIGGGLRNLLASHGIVTAADVTRPALAAIAGLGEARAVALLFWREAIAVDAERQVLGSGERAERAVAELGRFEARVSELEEAIRLEVADLDRRVAAVRKRASQVEPALYDALAAADQAAADLTYLGIKTNVASNVAAASTPAPVLANRPAKAKNKAGATKRTPKLCPRCSAPMVKRWTNGGQAGSPLFLGCSSYPKCTGTRPARRKRGFP